MKIGRPLAMIIYYHGPIQFGVLKNSGSDMCPNTMLRIIFKKSSKDVLKLKLYNFTTYNPYKIR